MTRRPFRFGLVSILALLMLGLLYWAASPGLRGVEQHSVTGRPPRMHPDYGGTVIPPNIAPLNFCVDEPGERYYVKAYSTRGKAVEVVSRTPRIRIPLRAWKELLDANRGEELRLDVYVKAVDGHWDRYEALSNRIAREEIDGYVVYRLFNSVYNLYEHMSIRQRSTEGYGEAVVWDNSSFGGCVNCHTFLSNRPDRMVIQTRSTRRQYGNAMLLVEGSTVRKLDTRTPFTSVPATYVSWHPSGRLLAFSANQVRQFFHTANTEVRDVVDLDSDLAICMTDSGTVTSTPGLCRPDRLETYPSWSPDGRYLYYCSAPVLWSDRTEAPPEHYSEVRYDLMRISYDLETGIWGEPETLLSSDRTGLSITLPRVSPDGRFLLFCMADYGCFPIHRSGADIYMMDLRSGSYDRLGANSDQADTWHSWSSNGRWFVFSSKRPDGLLARPYFAYVDQEGTVYKPFLLPQEDPAFYDDFLRTFNLPEFLVQPIEARGEEMSRAVASGTWVKAQLPVTGATPGAWPSSLPAGQGGNGSAGASYH